PPLAPPFRRQPLAQRAGEPRGSRQGDGNPAILALTSRRWNQSMAMVVFTGSILALASWCARLGRLQRLRTVKWATRPPVLAHQLAGAYRFRSEDPGKKPS